MVREQHQLVEEGEALIKVVGHHVESKQRASLMVLASFSLERDFLR